MEKFYVTSGEIRFVCLAKTQLEAIGRAIKWYRAKKPRIMLGAIIRVSRRGFKHHKEDLYFPTIMVLKTLKP